MIMSAFTDSGAPATGLTPAVTIYDLADDSVVVDAAAMSEVGGGIYKYSFSAYTVGTDYALYVDGGATLADADRYQYGSNIDERPIADAVWDEATSGHAGSGTFAEALLDAYDAASSHSIILGKKIIRPLERGGTVLLTESGDYLLL